MPAEELGSPVRQNDEFSTAISSTSTTRLSLMLRISICFVAAGIAFLPELSFGWKAHIILATFLTTIVALIALPEIPGTVLVICGLSILGISGAVYDHAFCLTSPPSPFTVATTITTIKSSDANAAKKKCSGLWWGFSASVTWLVASAILISAAVESSGLGRRVALLLLRALGGSGNLGVAYALCGAELVLAPVVPSNTARGGGCLAPVIAAITSADADAAGVSPGARPFVVLVAAQANLLSSAMFLTGSSGNILVVDAAR